MKQNTSTKTSSSKVFVVVPLYNEAKNLPKLLPKLTKLPYQWIFVDDGSLDGSQELLPSGKKVTVVRHVINRGVGAATQTGIDMALHLGADVVVTMDSDGQHDPKDIEKLVNALQTSNKDVIIGSRFLQKNKIPTLRRFYNFLGNIVTYFLAGIYVSDSQSGFKAFSRKAAEAIEIHANGYAFCSEIIREISWYSLSYKEVPITVHYFLEQRQKGQSFANGLQTVFKLIIRSLMRS